MTTSQFTVVYIPGFREQWDLESRSDHLERIVHNHNINFISVGTYDDDYEGFFPDHFLNICTNKDLVPEKLILIGFGRGAYIASHLTTILDRDHNQSVSSLFLISPLIRHHDEEHVGYFPPPLAERTTIFHGYNDTILHPNSVWEYCAEYSIPFHIIQDSHDFEEGVSTACYLLDLELKRLISSSV